MKFKSILLLAVIINVSSGCSSEKSVNGKVALHYDHVSDKGVPLVGIRIVPNKLFVGLALDFLERSQKDLANVALLENLEAELIEIGRGITNLTDVSISLFEIQQIRRTSQKKIELALAGFVRSMPPLNSQCKVGETFSIKSSLDSWLFFNCFDGQLVGNVTNQNKGSFWMVRAAECGESVVLSDDTMIRSAAQFEQILMGISKAPSSSVADKGLVEWAAAVRTRAIKAKQVLDEGLRLEKWSLAIEKQRNNRSVSGERFVLPGAFPEFTVVSVKSGEFIMGSALTDRVRGLDELEHKVVISKDFFISETECSQEQWQFVMTNNPSHFKGIHRPVEQISWEEASRFCNRLTELHRKSGVLSEDIEWRLPTECEWEYSCRAGGQGDGGLDLDLVAIYSKNSGSSTSKVKSKLPNAWGVYDMKGNVWEWCSDWYGDYKITESVDPVRISISSGRVFRGGGWFLGSEYCRSASRRWSAPSLRYSYVGFRPVLASVRPKSAVGAF